MPTSVDHACEMIFAAKETSMSKGNLYERYYFTRFPYGNDQVLHQASSDVFVTCPATTIPAVSVR